MGLDFENELRVDSLQRYKLWQNIKLSFNGKLAVVQGLLELVRNKLLTKVLAHVENIFGVLFSLIDYQLITGSQHLF